MSWKSKGAESNSKSVLSRKLTLLLCIGCFCVGMLFSDRMWAVPEVKGMPRRTGIEDKMLKFALEDCDPRIKDEKKESKDILGEVSKTHYAIQTLDKTISHLEMELAAARAAQDSILSGSPISEDLRTTEPHRKRKYLMVVGINTAFSSRKRRDSVRATWMPQGDKRKKLEEEKGIIIRFVIGHSATSGGILDRAIEAEEKKHGDILRLEHVEGYLELSAKTKIYFTTAVAQWDADFYVKVDDDVHVNIATLGATLMRHQSKPRVYIGCMKSGPVLAQKGVRYHEPEYWKFGEGGNLVNEILHLSSVDFRYMVCISAISAGYALAAAVSSWVKCLVTKAWFFFVSDQVVAYLLVTSGAAVGEIVYLAYKGDRDVTWSEACSSYGRFCTRLKIALAFHALTLCCFFVLAVISAYRVFSMFEPPLPSKDKEVEERTT